MILKQYIPPAAEPMHLTEAKLHLKAGGAVSALDAAAYTDEDDLLTVQISACRIVAETEQWRSLVLQTWDLYLPCFPLTDSIELPLPPLRSVVFARYTDSTGAVQDLSNYTVDRESERGRLVLDFGYYWPMVVLAPNNPIHIRFKCGYLVPFTKSGATVAIPDSPFTVGDRVRLSVSGGVLPAPLKPLTDYYITATGLSLTDGGADVAITADGTGNCFIGELPACTMVGMKLVLTDLYQERADTVIGRSTNSLPQTIPRAASHYFAMDTARVF